MILSFYSSKTLLIFSLSITCDACAYQAQCNFLPQILAAEMKKMADQSAKEMRCTHGQSSLCVRKRHTQRVSGSDKYAAEGHTHSRTSSIGGGRRGVLLSHKGQGRDNYSARETSAKEENICMCVRKGRSSIGNAHAIAVTFISRIVGFQNSRQRFVKRIVKIFKEKRQRSI